MARREQGDGGVAGGVAGGVQARPGAVQDPGEDATAHAVNEVTLGGRISGSPERRELPSGDSVVQLRVVVRRSAVRARGARAGATVDTIDVACWTAALRRKAARLQDGDLVTVRGALRRRFWRSPGGAASRYEVEAAAIERGIGS